jgi:hypothetical protein
MKKSLARIFAGLVITGTVLLVNPISKSKQTEAFPPIGGCRLTALNGTYGFAFNGYVNTGSPIPFTPLAAAGTITFHPDGTFSRSFICPQAFDSDNRWSRHLFSSHSTNAFSSITIYGTRRFARAEARRCLAGFDRVRSHRVAYDSNCR